MLVYCEIFVNIQAKLPGEPKPSRKRSPLLKPILQWAMAVFSFAVCREGSRCIPYVFLRNQHNRKLCNMRLPARDSAV